MIRPPILRQNNELGRRGYSGRFPRLGLKSNLRSSFLTQFFSYTCVGVDEAMPTNLAINDELLEEARRLGGHRTKKATVNEALQEYIDHRRQEKILDLFGQIDYDPDYDYKKQRALG